MTLRDDNRGHGKRCENKIRYRDQLGAMIALAGAQRRDMGERMYRCPICRGWHLTTQQADPPDDA